MCFLPDFLVCFAVTTTSAQKLPNFVMESFVMDVFVVESFGVKFDRDVSKHFQWLFQTDYAKSC